MGELARESDSENTLLLVGLAEDAGGCIDLERMLGRPAGSTSRLACVDAMDRGWIDGRGRVTASGGLALARWRHG